MRIVTPFRPFVAESVEQKNLGPFDWLGAIDMLRESARRSCGIEVVSITDVDTELAAPSLQFRTEHRRLMPWIVEVALRYIESDAFDQDTIMVSPDVLVFGNPGAWFKHADFDLGMLARHHPARPLINSVQFWPVARRAPLRTLYRAVFESLGELSEEQLVWGGDTTPFVKLFGPVEPGRISIRHGGRVRFLDLESVMTAYSDVLNRRERPDRLVDFRYLRKHCMRAFFERNFQPMLEVNGWFFAAADRFMAKEINAAGEYQRQHLIGAMAATKQHRLAVDGGAHVGTWSVPMARVFERVMAFEPSADTFEALKANLARQGAGNVKARQVALGAATGRAEMTLDGDERAIADGNLGARFVRAGDKVPVVPLDSYRLEDLDFLKLDVEGSEVAALQGARQTLKRCRPVVLFEDKGHWKRYGHGRRAPHELLASLGAKPIRRVGSDEIWGWRDGG
jgi:FkbM family methyltransferase